MARDQVFLGRTMSYFLPPFIPCSLSWVLCVLFLPDSLIFCKLRKNLVEAIFDDVDEGGRIFTEYIEDLGMRTICLFDCLLLKLVLVSLCL